MNAFDVVEKEEGFLGGTQLAGDFEERSRGGGEEEAVEMSVGGPVIWVGGLEEGDYLWNGVGFGVQLRWRWRFWMVLGLGGEVAEGGGRRLRFGRF